MKLALASAALLGLALAPAAYAQVSCSEVRRVIEESEYDFDEITGAKIEEDYYKATFSLSGADECTIDYEWDSIYSCGFQYQSYASATAAWNAQAAAVSSCLAGWAPSSVTPESTATNNGYRVLMGALYVGSGAFEDLEWAVVLEEHAETGSTHYHLWVELAYYW